MGYIHPGNSVERTACPSRVLLNLSRPSPSGVFGGDVARLFANLLRTDGPASFMKLAAECESAGYPGVLVPYKCDLSMEEEIMSMFSAIKTLHKGVDVCINNAGLARPEPLLSGRTEGWRSMIDVNMLAMSICTREAYQSMKERNVDDGHIINVSSVNGHVMAPQSIMHFYSATKHAVTALTEGLRQELREAKTHIRATCISPGLVETEFTFKLHDNDPERAAATYESIKRRRFGQCRNLCSQCSPSRAGRLEVCLCSCVTEGGKRKVRPPPGPERPRLLGVRRGERTGCRWIRFVVGVWCPLACGSWEPQGVPGQAVGPSGRATRKKQPIGDIQLRPTEQVS
ncbi:Dehydrogenase/reductase SDR family member 11 [Varanus komodoensis]|nr:Dehydrogenase/reductase SDR family member 11 [Varanus komodoensis]